MNQMGRTAMITPAQQGSVVVFDALSESQDPDEIERLGAALAHELIVPVVAILIHDDDMMMLWVCMPRKVTASYGKTFDAPVTAYALSVALGNRLLAPALFLALANPFYIFQSARHRKIVRISGLNTWAVSTGYDYLSQNEFPEGLTSDMLLKSTGTHKTA